VSNKILANGHGIAAGSIFYSVQPETASKYKYKFQIINKKQIQSRHPNQRKAM